jgi:uncharacterized membrane protein
MDLFLILLRWLHFLFGITWIGLLYYFNLVQVPFFAETEAPVRVGAQVKLLPRAMWWFRWGAMGTVIVGVLYLIIYWAQTGWSFNSWAVAILTGGTLGLVMWYNVWFVIWPNQKIVIANAVTTSGGGQANPAAAPAGRRAGLASRTNVMFSIPMLFFMGAASHYPYFNAASSVGILLWIILAGAVIAALEANALVGTQGTAKKPLDSIPGVITAGFVVWFVLLVIIKITV